MLGPKAWLIATAAALSACTQIVDTPPAIAEQPAAVQADQVAKLVTPTPRPVTANPWPHPRPKVASPLRSMPPRYNSTGVASWYGPKFHGRLTASGEVYDMNDLTAAHRSLPFGTELQVTNLTNNQTLTVIVNDRGPYVGKRVIDVSYQAAVQLGFVNDGLADVVIVEVQ